MADKPARVREAFKRAAAKANEEKQIVLDTLVQMSVEQLESTINKSFRVIEEKIAAALQREIKAIDSDLIPAQDQPDLTQMEVSRATKGVLELLPAHISLRLVAGLGSDDGSVADRAHSLHEARQPQAQVSHKVAAAPSSASTRSKGSRALSQMPSNKDGARRQMALPTDVDTQESESDSTTDGEDEHIPAVPPLKRSSSQRFRSAKRLLLDDGEDEDEEPTTMKRQRSDSGSESYHDASQSIGSRNSVITVPNASQPSSSRPSRRAAVGPTGGYNVRVPFENAGLLPRRKSS